MATFVNLLNNGLNNNFAVDLAQGVQFSNQPIGNPGFLTPEQLATFFVGNVVGATKEVIYSIGIKNTELLHRKLVNPADPTQTPIIDDPNQILISKNPRESQFGTPIFDWVTLRGTKYYSIESVSKRQDEKGTSNLDTFTTPKLKDEFFLGLDFVTCMVKVDKAIDIVQTKTSGSIQGTIKEYMGSGEWNVNLTAYITPLSDENRMNYNVDAINEFKKLADINVPIEVESYFLSLLGITHLVPTNISISPVEGVVGVVQAEMQFISDSQIIPKA